MLEVMMELQLVLTLVKQSMDCMSALKELW